VTGTIPRRGTGQYRDYTGLKTTLDSLVDQAKHELNVRLPGDQPPPVSHFENTSPPGMSRPPGRTLLTPVPMAFPATT
jgi:hypothetical protein